MAASKQKGKAIQFQIGWAGLVAIVVSCVCVLLWTFVLGFWMGQKVATGNSKGPKVSVYSPGTKAQEASGPALGYHQPGNEIQIGPKEDESAMKQFSALKESLKEEASKGGIKTEVLPGASPDKETGGVSAELGSKAGEAGPEGQKGAELGAGSKRIRKEKKKEAERAVQRKKGVKKVKTEEISRPAREASKPFALQIASYRTLAQARKEAERWKKKGYFVRVRSANLGKRGTWYRVYLGRYRSLDKAKRASMRIAAKEGLRSYVTKVSK